MLDLCLANSRILYFWYALESIHKLVIELHVLQCLFVKGSIEKQRNGRIISHVTKKTLFHLLWQPSALRGNLIMWLPFLHPLKKVFLSLSIWPKRQYRYLDNQLKAEFTDLFWKLSDVPYMFFFFKKHKFKKREAQNAEILRNIWETLQVDINKHNWKNYVF